ncbi:MAG: hypothetical protein LBB58_07070 [Cellulomonadaceae bacterium]|nr:hypothetical protein [Cellulomonadaceae bacterium]
MTPPVDAPIPARPPIPPVDARVPARPPVETPVRNQTVEPVETRRLSLSKPPSLAHPAV